MANPYLESKIKNEFNLGLIDMRQFDYFLYLLENREHIKSIILPDRYRTGTSTLMKMAEKFLGW